MILPSLGGVAKYQFLSIPAKCGERSHFSVWHTIPLLEWLPICRQPFNNR